MDGQYPQYPWAEALGFTHQQILEWETHLPGGVSLLQWCLENQKLDEESYLLWAHQHYQLPILKRSYFDNPPPLELIEKYRSLIPPTLMAVTEWDGILFLACLEPQPPIALGQPYQLLLASPSGMKKWMAALGLPTEFEPHVQAPPSEAVQTEIALDFSALDKSERANERVGDGPTTINEEQTVMMAMPPATAVIPEPDALVSVPPALPSLDGLSFGDLMGSNHEETVAMATPAAPAEAPLDAPSVSSFDSLDFGSLGAHDSDSDDPVPATSMHEEATPPPFQEPTVMMKMPDEPIAPAVAEPTPTATAAVVTPTPAPAPPVPAATNTPPSAAKIPSPAPIRGAVKPMMPPPGAKVPQPAVLFPINKGVPQPTKLSPLAATNPAAAAAAAATPTSTPAPLQTPAATQPTLAGTIVLDPKLRLDDPRFIRNPEQIPFFTLYRLSDIYEQSMIMTYLNNVLMPWRWDSNWMIRVSEASPIDLSAPSIFKTVFYSKGSYHGRIAPSKINDIFMRDWRGSEYPEHITVCPMFADGMIIGLILGTCKTERAKTIKLTNIERLAQETAELFISAGERAA